MKKIKNRARLFTVIMLTSITLAGYAQEVNKYGKALKLLPGESWWGGVANKGVDMPMGKKHFSFDLYGDDDGNQAAPLLISNKGRHIWGETPFKYTFRNDSLVIERRKNDFVIDQDGKTLKDAYKAASKKHFPSSGLWPDSLFVTAPQMMSWMYGIQFRILNYFIAGR